MLDRDVEYLPTPAGRIAVARTGTSPLPVVLVPGLLSHVDALWTDPAFERWAGRLATQSTFVTYDRLGTGASDPAPRPRTTAERDDELTAVLETCSAPAVVVGWFDGAPTAVRAARLPAVRGVVAMAGYSTASVANIRRRIGDSWGEGAVGAALHPSGHGGELLERMTATASVGRELLRTLESGALESTTVPSAADARVALLHPVRSIVGSDAGTITVANAQVVVVAGADVVPWGDGAGAVSRAIRELGGLDAPSEASGSTSLRGVLVVDIVSSTAKAARAGDREWRHLLETFDTVVQERVRRHGGEVVRATGDGMIAIFDSAQATVRAAVEVTQEATRVGLPARTGAHVGDVHRDGDGVHGTTIRTAVAISELGEASSVLISVALRDAAAGAGLRCRPLHSRPDVFVLDEEPPAARA